MDPLVRALLDPAAYDHPVQRVELRETHISWVFLTGLYAYKVKKPVQFGFVDFRSAARRRHCCEEEVRLNRRLAAELYLGVRPIHGPRERASLQGDGPVIETAVWMRQFRQRDLLPEALERGEVAAPLFDQLARQLARFHAAAARAAPDTPWGQPAQVLAPALANLEALQRCGRLPADHEALRRWTLAELERLTPLLERRRARGRIRECHGDLHLGNMALHEGGILVFDGIEFSEALRWIDPISDLAFLLMDLRHRGRSDLARRILQGWLAWGGDFESLHLLRWLLAYRALVRAKVCALRLDQGDLEEAESGSLVGSLKAYVQEARDAMAPCRGSLLITHGVSGSGKSHMAALLGERGWLVLRSDLERLRLFGRWGEGSDGVLPAGADPYAGEVTAHLYGTVLPDAAAAALAAGLAVVVDATFLHGEDRSRFRNLARDCGAGFGILAPSADAAVALERIERRRMEGVDPSEADAGVLARQLAGMQPLSLEEEWWRLSSVDDPRLAELGSTLPVPGLSQV